MTRCRSNARAVSAGYPSFGDSVAIGCSLFAELDERLNTVIHPRTIPFVANLSNYER